MAVGQSFARNAARCHHGRRKRVRISPDPSRPTGRSDACHGDGNVSCPDPKELLAFAAGALETSAADRVAAHIEACDPCGERVAGAFAHVEPDFRVASGEPPDVTPDEWNRVWRGIESA